MRPCDAPALPPFPKSSDHSTASTASPRRSLPLEGFLPPAAVPCHHGRCLPGVYLAPSARFPTSRFQLPVSRTVDMKPHLQGLAPREGEYFRRAVASVRKPVLPGLFSPSRSFDRRATEAAYRRTAPALRVLRPDRAASVGADPCSLEEPCKHGFGEHRSVPHSKPPSRRTSRRGRARRHGSDARHTRRCSQRSLRPGPCCHGPGRACDLQFPAGRRSFGRCRPPRGPTFAP
jgi:hypothetical protein